MAQEMKSDQANTFSHSNLPPGTYETGKYGLIDLSICLVSWNTASLLRDCISSIFHYSNGLRIEIFVIDNASSDNSVDMVSKEFPTVTLVKNSFNVGFARANNQAIEKSRGRHVLLLNPDTLILQGSLQKMVSFLDENSNTGAVAARLLNTDKTLQYSLRKFPDILTPFTENTNLSRIPGIHRFSRKSRLMDWNHDEIREVEQPAGAAFMIKRYVLETLGPLNSCYHMFFEDVDLCFRIRKNGWKIFYLPDAEIIHHGGQSVKKRTDMGIQFYRSLIKYFMQHCGTSGVIKVRFSMVAFSIYCLLFSLLTVYREPSGAVLTAKSSLNVIRAAFFRVRCEPS